MTQEEKELLLKELCARLPYGVRCKYYNIYENCYEEGTISGFERKEYIEIGGECVNIEEIKPYLFPLSSLTKEQKEEISDLFWDFDNNEFTNNTEIVDHCDCFNLIDWLNKNHFDYRVLIKKGLAIDATGLNIY